MTGIFQMTAVGGGSERYRLQEVCYSSQMSTGSIHYPINVPLNLLINVCCVALRIEISAFVLLNKRSYPP